MQTVLCWCCTQKNFIYDTVVTIRFLGLNYKTPLFCTLKASKLCLDDYRKDMYLLTNRALFYCSSETQPQGPSQPI